VGHQKNGEIKKSLESKKNENTTYQNLWDTAKAILKTKLIAMITFIKKIREAGF
jgi:hypothetical protein